MSDNEKLEPALYLVPTPIGNLEDITLRALRILRNVDFIACEDTRNASKLLKLLDVNDYKLISYHNFNEASRAEEIILKIISGSSVALISDAGTPCISDPGYRLVAEAIKQDVKIVSLPGANAILPALIASGMPVHSFKFLGFPPQKKGRSTFIKEALGSPDTVICYESTHKIAKFVEEINAIAPERKICIAKEISKLHERYIRGNASDVLAILKDKNLSKGEFVVLIAPEQMNEKLSF